LRYRSGRGRSLLERGTAQIVIVAGVFRIPLAKSRKSLEIGLRYLTYRKVISAAALKQ
jgi:hypothetical protein